MGRVVDALGILIDGGEILDLQERLNIERKAPGVITVNLSLNFINWLQNSRFMLPIGRGNENLLWRSSNGKTTIAMTLS